MLWPVKERGDVSLTLKWQKLSSTQLSLREACHGLPAHHTPFRGLVMPDLLGSRTPTPDSWDYKPRVQRRKCRLREVAQLRGSQ